MDLSVSATTYLPAQPGNGRGPVATPAGKQAADGETTARDGPAALAAEARRGEAARRQAPLAEAASSPGFRFEYEDNHRVMKVQNGKGYLIYQVPSKGQLALVQAEEVTQQHGQQIELTA